jgi:hypothetical protein
MTTCQLCHRATATDVFWMLTERCPELEAADYWLEHVQSCPRHVHVHTCQECAQVDVPHVSIVTFGDLPYWLATPDAVAAFEHEHA